MNSIATV